MNELYWETVGEEDITDKTASLTFVSMEIRLHHELVIIISKHSTKEGYKNSRHFFKSRKCCSEYLLP
jgi:hypothetical protein